MILVVCQYSESKLIQIKLKAVRQVIYCDNSDVIIINVAFLRGVPCPSLF